MAILWIHGKVIHPATMTIAADHDTPAKRVFGSCHQQFGRGILQTLANVVFRIVPRAGQITVVPKLHESFLIRSLECPDLDR
jgi:hypothetical protein